jgi:uncharacterized membrane-anchored protein YjiN (DUF445 family)
VTDDPLALGLRRMQRIALALLAAAALLYGLAVTQEHRHPAWAYVAAFAEAAMVGAIADWFAVVALFRHPLGLPIPHTAIVPANKARIGRRLGDFIVQHFLAPAPLVQRLQAWDPAARLAQWLSQPEPAARVAAHASGALLHLLAALDDERVQRFVEGAVGRRLQQLDVAPLAGRLLQGLTAEGRHQDLLDLLMRQLGERLQDESVKARLAEMIGAELRYLRYVGLDQVAASLATDKLINSVGRLLDEMAADRDHALRQRFDAAVDRFIQRLQHDPALQDRGRTLMAELATQPALRDALAELWRDLRRWLEEGLRGDDGALRERLAEQVQRLGRRLDGDAALRDWLNGELVQAAPRWLDRWRPQIGDYIAVQVEAWDTAALSSELERHIGRDLQFVRINGTLVGGLVGLGIHSVTVWLRG